MKRNLSIGVFGSGQTQTGDWAEYRVSVAYERTALNSPRRIASESERVTERDGELAGERESGESVMFHASATRAGKQQLHPSL